MNPRANLLIGVVVTSLLGCSHALEVKNAQLYATPLRLGETIERPMVAFTPFQGAPDALFYHDAIVRRFTIDPAIGGVRTDYTPKLAESGAFQPDVILTVRPTVTYRSSGWNFLINWPGFLIFTPSWNGYVYRADVLTHITIFDGAGNAVDQVEIPISYDIRHADMDRTIWTGLTWLEVSALAFFGGFYNAGTFDRDVIAPLQINIKDNYAEYVIAQAQQRVVAQADVFRRGRAQRAGAETGDAGTPPVASPPPPEAEEREDPD